MKKSLFLLVALLPFCQGHSQVYIPAYGDVVNQCSATTILNNLTTYEGLGVKRKNTPALANTLTWLKNQYLSFGYTQSQLVEDSFSYSGATCKNLVVTKIGTLYPNTFVIISGHYDSITGTGTNDNGSGVVTILEIARLLQNIPTEYSIKFINFAGEEDGLIGSQHYVSSVVNATTPKMNIRLVFNIDEVGGVAGMVNNTITCERDTGSPTSNNNASNTITSELMTCVDIYSPLNTLLSYAYASDYMPFEANYEIITGFFETNETPHRHTATDLLVNMDPNYVYNIAKAAIGATLHFAKASTVMGNQQLGNDFQVGFFANPTTQIITINKGIISESRYTFSLIDIQGKPVMAQQIIDSQLVEQVNVNGLSKGIYLGVLETATHKITKKIVLQ